jgi:hypothetical protein
MSRLPRVLVVDDEAEVLAAMREQENVALHAVAEGVGAALRGLREIEEVLPLCMDCGRVKTAAHAGRKWLPC